MATIKAGNGPRSLNVGDHKAGDTFSFIATMSDDQSAYTWTAWLRHDALNEAMPLVVDVSAPGAPTAVTVTLDLERAPLVKPGTHRWRLHRLGVSDSKTRLSGEWETEVADA